jgi:hypothetical protein
MNTSFGPRIDEDRWDFHDGIDLPAPIGTPVYAMRAGRIYRAGEPGTHKFSSRHVVVRTKDPDDGPMFHLYLHLDSIDPAISQGVQVAQGQQIGRVGKDDATYPHLHMEIRKNILAQAGSVHPLAYLPYTDTLNLTAPVSDRFNRLDARMAARLLFTADSKLEGDLQKVEVDLKRGERVMSTRTVDFDDKTTIMDSKGDDQRFVNGICVEGYQKSNMIAHRRADLAYGILVKAIPPECEGLVARVIDVGGNVATSAFIDIPDQVATDEFLDFEDGQVSPGDWRALTSSSGTGTSISVDASAARSGSMGLLCIDSSTTETSTQRAALERDLPAGRFEWRVEAWLNPAEIALEPAKSIHLFEFRNSDGQSVAARIYQSDEGLRPGLIAHSGDGAVVRRDASSALAAGQWRKWRLELLRVATRETTAILFLNDGGRMQEQVRLNWDSTEREPIHVRAGIARSSSGATATLFLDELWLTEAEMPV